MDKEKYLTSKETMKALKIQACDLMHLRLKGKLEFVKKGNAILYTSKSVKKLEK